MRKRQFSDITGQSKPGGGFRDPIEVAREKVNWIIENHHPEPLEKAKQSELAKILKIAEKELEN